MEDNTQLDLYAIVGYLYLNGPVGATAADIRAHLAPMGLSESRIIEAINLGIWNNEIALHNSGHLYLPVPASRRFTRTTKTTNTQG